MRDLLLEWQELWIPEFIPRDIDKTVLFGKVRKVVVLTGCRRSGKTFIMYQMMDDLQKQKGISRENILYLSFEDERLPWTTETLTKLLPTLYELHGEREYYLFLDEIHHIPGWDRWVRRVYDRHQNIHFVLASSSSKLSRREIPDALRGRTSILEVFPLSFQEFLRFKDVPEIDPTRSTELKLSKYYAHLKEYLEFGGFPEVVLESTKRKRISIIQDYFRTIITLDIAERYDIKNRRALHDYIQMVLAQTYHSTSKMQRILNDHGINIGKETILAYPHYLEEVYMIFFVPIFSKKVKDRLYYPQKVYFIDNSFIHHVTPKFSDDLGRGLENAVFLHLFRTKGREGLFYWKEKNKEAGSGFEVDFVLVKDRRAYSLIQVCFKTSDEKTKEREIRGLVLASEELECDRLTIVTLDYEGIEKFNEKTIKFIPYLKWTVG
jgi:uncharacterized protein